LTYGLSFAAITATLTHSFLYFRKLIWAQSRRSMREQLDIHARLMSKYKQVPEWWYGIIFGAFISCDESHTSNSCAPFDSVNVRVCYYRYRDVAYRAPGVGFLLLVVDLYALLDC